MNSPRPATKTFGADASRLPASVPHGGWLTGRDDAAGYLDGLRGGFIRPASADRPGAGWLDIGHLHDRTTACRPRRAAETDALLDTLHSNAPVGLGFVDRHFRLVHVNGSAGRHERLVDG